MGPHFFYDLIRLARRSRTRDLRMLYGMALLLGLGLVYWIQFPHDDLGNLLFNPGQPMRINESARFAETFVFTVIVVQNLAVLLLTPVYVGSAIAEEKERKTLDLLFATQMKDREIILGKLFSRLTHLGAILLGGLPVLSLAQLWGGIDFHVLVANFVNTGMILLSVGSISILVSTLCRKVVTAVMIIYGFVLPITLCLGIFSIGGRTSVLGLAQSDMGANPGMMGIVLGGLGAFHGIIAVACVSVALVVMRGQHGGNDYFNPQPASPPRRRRLRGKPLGEGDQQLSLQVDRLYDLPPIHNDPLFWKELNVGINKQITRPLFFTFLGLSLAALFLATLAMSFETPGLGPRPWTERSHQMGVPVKLLCVGWGLFCCVAVAYTTSSAIVRERQQGTLEALLTLPVSRLELLRAKWLGCFFRAWPWWECLAVAVFLGTILTTIQLSGGMLLLAAVLIHGAFLCSLGLFLSVVSKTVLSAHAKMALILLFLFFGTWLFSEVIAVSLTARYGEFLRIGLNPVRTWWALAFSWRDFLDASGDLDRQFAGALLGLAFYVLLAIVFWLLACWRFGKESSRAVD
ncbi:MAG TPA: ABC transporter permease subunit [Gemmataceae bacterium]|jgi:ABC-type transport system involved in multi-copper enzyme maturation permease subunit|nr:ABC transporter permease subunit [Gemmataceae bacterium]